MIRQCKTFICTCRGEIFQLDFFTKMDPKKFLVQNRWIVSVILLPISFLYDIFWYLLSKYNLWKGCSPGKHRQKVEYVQKQVREWKTKGKGRKMCTARPQWMSISQQKINYKAKSYQVEVNMMDMLELDEKNRRVWVEPMVNMERLLQALIPKGWVVPIVPEIGDLTVGGLVMGGGIETTSHKWGLWQHICTGYEIVVADGSVLKCSETENSDLYWAIPWSYGTFGFLTAVELMIIPYKPYVKLTYTPTHSFDDTVDTFCRETERKTGNDSVEGIMYSKDTGVIMTGEYVDNCDPGLVNRIGLWFKPWFYQHAKGYLKKGKGVEYIPTNQFFFRHFKPYFWLTHIAIPFGNHPIFRYLFGWTMPYNHGLLKFINEKILGEAFKDMEETLIVQDFGFSFKRMKYVLEYYHEQVEIYPIWLCPAVQKSTGPVNSHKDKDQIYHVDIGLYGASPRIRGHEKVTMINKLERHAIANNGYQGLYAEICMSYEEFQEMFDGSHYRKVRAALPLTEEAFPEVYDKISKRGRS